MPAAIMRMDSLQSVILKYQNKFTQLKLHMIATNVRRAFPMQLILRNINQFIQKRLHIQPVRKDLLSNS